MWEQQFGTIVRPTIWAGSGSIDATFIDESGLFRAWLSLVLRPNHLGCIVDEFLYMSLFYDNAQSNMLFHCNGNCSSNKPFSPIHRAGKNAQQAGFFVPMGKDWTAA